MTRAVDLHPFQPTSRHIPLVERCIAFVSVVADEPGLLECLAVILLAALLPLIQPEWMP